jgi:hypothetical protein
LSSNAWLESCPLANRFPGRVAPSGNADQIVRQAWLK